MPLFDLSERVKLRLSGSDRVRFLNGQVTNDVRKANAHLALPACVLSAKGKIDALVFISASQEALHLDTDPELRAALPQRLERYLIADDVAIEDVTERYSLFHLTREDAPTLPNDIPWRQARRFGTSGWDLIAPASEHDRLLEQLAAEDQFCDAASAEQLRIEAGVPCWGRELTNEIIPVEANLADEAIDYAKGCYIGQEVISRMKISGQTNKRLRGLVSVQGSPLAAETCLTTSDGNDRKVGWITSATRSDRLGKEIALGFVKRGHNEAGTILAAGTGTVELVELPFGGQRSAVGAVL